MALRKAIIYDDGALKIEKTICYARWWIFWKTDLKYDSYRITENGMFQYETYALECAINFLRYRIRYNKAPLRIILVDGNGDFFIAIKSKDRHHSSNFFVHNEVNYNKSVAFASLTEARYHVAKLEIDKKRFKASKELKFVEEA